MHNASEIAWSSSSGHNTGENEYICLVGIYEKTLTYGSWQSDKLLHKAGKAHPGPLPC